MMGLKERYKKDLNEFSFKSFVVIIQAAFWAMLICWVIYGVSMGITMLVITVGLLLYAIIWTAIAIFTYIDYREEKNQDDNS